VWGIFLTFWAGGLGDLLAAALYGAAAGAAFGLLLSPAMSWFVEGLSALPPMLPPRRVVRLGAALGAAEGVVLGAVYAQVAGAVLGGYWGLVFGGIFSALSWRLRRQAPLLVASVLIGGAVEAVGCTFIGLFVQMLAAVPLFMVIVGLQTVVMVVFNFRGFCFWAFGHGLPEEA
jgi:hypothetical protein